MIKVFQSIDSIMQPVEQITDGCYLQVISPTEEEIQQLERLGIFKDFIRYALDEEEVSRVESDQNQTLLMIDIPRMPRGEVDKIHSTIPMGFIVLPNLLISICSKENSLFTDFEKLPHITTGFKTRFVLQFLGKTAGKYMNFLREMARITDEIEKLVVNSISNKEIMKMMKIQKSLVYLDTSLKGNEMTLERIRQGKVMQLFPEDAGLMDDVLIEFRQAREMADIHERILANTMDNYGSIIANNMNDIVKVLTIITIIFSIPMITFGLYGMNVQGLWFDGSPYFAISVTGLIMLVVTLIFYRKKML